MRQEKKITGSEAESVTGKVGWHLIARGGDMTARIHPGMRLGVDAMGELSFQPEHAVVELDLVDGGLSLFVVADGFELEVPRQGRLRAYHVRPELQVKLTLFDHTLFISNALVISRSVSDRVSIAVVGQRTAERPRTTLGPVSAPPHEPLEGDWLEADILAPEALPARWRSVYPVDPRSAAHLDAALPGGQAVRKSWRAPIALATLLITVVAGMAAVSVWIGQGGRMKLPRLVFEMPATVAPTAPVQPAPVPVTAAPAGPDPDVLIRFAALIDADPLPDLAAIDFAVESMLSLAAIYPQDERIPAALTRLTERLIVEAQVSAGKGDAFRAGRLMAQASATGAARESVGRVMALLAASPVAVAAPAADIQAPPSPVVAVPVAAAESPSRESTLPDAAEQPEAAASMEPDSSARATEVMALGSAADLPVGLFVDDGTSGSLAAERRVETLDPQDIEAQLARPIEPELAGPAYYEFTRLTPTYQVPLEYPRQAPRGSEGFVELEFTVTETGEVRDLQTRGNAADYFLRAAEEAMSRWRFQPVEENGAAVPVRTALRVTFRS